MDTSHYWDWWPFLDEGGGGRGGGMERDEEGWIWEGGEGRREGRWFINRHTAGVKALQYSVFTVRVGERRECVLTVRVGTPNTSVLHRATLTARIRPQRWRSVKKKKFANKLFPVFHDKDTQR